jgi:hypothetical protein
MSFACRPQSGAFFVFPGIPLGSSYSSSGTGADVSLSVVFKRNGSLSVTRVQGLSGGSTLLSEQWYSVLQNDIGLSHYVRVTPTLFAPTGAYTSGVWYQISGDISFDWIVTSAGTKNPTCTFEISTTITGSNIVASVTGVALTVTYT